MKAVAKKIITPVSVLVILIPCIMLVMACGETEQKKERIPENIFVGSEYEHVEYIHNNYFDSKTLEYVSEETDEIFYHKKLSFAENTFSFYEKRHPSYEHTYTGTYSLFFGEYLNPEAFQFVSEDQYRDIRINFVSDEPSMNGTAQYLANFVNAPDSTVQFRVCTGLLGVVEGKYTKIN